MRRAQDDSGAASWLGPAIAVGAVALIALLSLGRVTAVFGDSDEGINGAVWATDSRALREAGPIDSHLGGVRLDATKYATHPPAIVLEAAAAETLAGEREWATRAGAWLGSLVAIFLLYRLLRAARFSALTAGAATAITAATPMILAYGSMLDTPVIAFPFGVAVVLLWYRQWGEPPGERATDPLLVGLVCVAAGIAGWQAVVLGALCGLTLAVRGLRRRSGLGEAVPFLAGIAIGLALSLGWIYWVYGDFSELAGKYSRRTGAESGVTLLDMVDFQVPWLIQLLGVGMVGIAGCVAALWNRPLRPLAAMSLAIVGVYAVIFHQAAAGHQYWNYWALLPAAVGASYLIQRLVDDAGNAANALVIGLVVLVGVINVTVWPNLAAEYIDDAHHTVEAFRAATYPEDQTKAWYVGETYRPDAWMGYYGDLTPAAITTVDELQDLVETNPDALVVVLDSCRDRPGPTEVCQALEQSNPTDAPASVVTASDLLAAVT